MFTLVYIYIYLLLFASTKFRKICVVGKLEAMSDNVTFFDGCVCIVFTDNPLDLKNQRNTRVKDVKYLCKKTKSVSIEEKSGPLKG